MSAVTRVQNDISASVANNGEQRLRRNMKFIPGVLCVCRMAAQQLSTNFRKLELSKIETTGHLRLDP